MGWRAVLINEQRLPARSCETRMSSFTTSLHHKDAPRDALSARARISSGDSNVLRHEINKIPKRKYRCVSSSSASSSPWSMVRLSLLLRKRFIQLLIPPHSCGVGTSGERDLRGRLGIHWIIISLFDHAPNIFLKLFLLSPGVFRVKTPAQVFSPHVQLLRSSIGDR